jgi:GT2 family glycosyltransferase
MVSPPKMSAGAENRVGIVVIGRNEGDRLKRCLRAAFSQCDIVVYVDSGSSDDSVTYAESRGADVVRLDTGRGFSAARARNEGFHQLIRNHNEIEFVQFIDGDCEMSQGWLLFARAYLERNESCAIVAGRMYEQHKDYSIYNRLCDFEWNTEVGEAKACGGVFMIRRKAFQNVGGFNPEVVAGEEPELCYRLRRSNWSISRLDASMNLHDAHITRFSQWLKRQLRCGYSYTQVFSLQRRDKNPPFRREILSTWSWAFVLPCIVLILSTIVSWYFLALLCLYAYQQLKIAVNAKKRIGSWKQSLIYGFFIVIAKWPNLAGQLLFMKRNFVDKRHSIIEYK